VREYDKSSNHYKFNVYKQDYDIEFRHKYTGFEKLEELDKDVRKKLTEYLGSDELLDYYTLTDDELGSDDTTFRDELKANASNYTDTYNLVYMSGGIDSEITALAFVDADIEFVPVIFKWTDKAGIVLNDYDTKYAFLFCEHHNLVPLVREFDVESFWESNEVFDYADKYKYSSPQILTYYKMIDVMDKELDDDYE